MNKRAFLKYPGGKYKQLEQIKELLPNGERLVEPFVGAASVFLNTDYPRYLLADVNPDLINTFKIIAAYQEDFIARCKEYFTPFTNNLETYKYYRHVFNNLDLKTITHERRINKACLFVYLNRHGFRGMVRSNTKGEFNVPYGYYYDSVYFPEQEMVNFIAKVNSAELVEFKVADFRDTLNMVQQGDVIYCDPPYVPLTATANFNKYSGKAFSWYEQVELLSMCKKLKAELEVCSIISNHDTAATNLLYTGGISKMVKSFVGRSISYKARNPAPELMVCL